MDTQRDFQRRLADARAGEGSALGELFRDLYPRVVRYLSAFEPHEADDLASDTWIGVVSALARFEGDEGGLRALAFTIARRRLADLRRSRSRRPAEPAEPERLERLGEVGDVEQEALAELATREALQRVAALPQEQAEVVLLRVVGGLSAEDVARIVGKRAGTVRVIQHRALRRLAEELSEERVTP
jgi:RNA polymerase sigma-70 factor (ECF subfamily)